MLICGPELCRRDGIKKTRLETNIYGCLLRLVLLLKLAYSDGTDLILSCWNSNEESGPGFSVFSVFRPKSRFGGKNCKTFLSSVAHKTWLKRYMTVIMGSFWNLGAKDYNWEQNWNFTHHALQEIRFEFQKAIFWRKLKKWLFSNRCLYCLVQFILMKLGIFV